MTNTAPTPRVHLAFLDGLRGIAALYIVLHHAWLTVWPIYLPNRFPPASVFRWTRPLQYGHIAVDLFIVLSGFCLMLPVVRTGVLKGGAWLFFQKRARRILPPYYCALGLSLLLCATVIGHKTGSHWDSALPVTHLGIALHLLLVQDMNTHTFSQINHALWSISVEWRIYFLFPLLVWLWRRMGSIPAAAAGVATSYVLVVVFLHAVGQSWTAQYIGLFVMGMLGADIATTQAPALTTLRERIPWLPATAVLTVLMAAVPAGLFTHGQRVPAEQSDYLVGLWAMSLLVMLTLSPQGMAHRVCAARPLVFAGTFAYSIYLVHAPLLQVVWQYCLRPLHLSELNTFLLLATAGTALVVGASYLFFLACERPFLNTRRGETPAETARDAALSPAP